jgi:CRISPR-associated protein Cas6
MMPPGVEHPSVAEHFVDIAFPSLGKELPLDHGYALFAALSRIVPGVHERQSWGVHPVRGVRSDRDRLILDRQSFVKLRMPVDDVKHVLSLAGARLDVEGYAVTLGIPRLFPLVPAASLKARVVTVKGHCESEAALLDSCRRKLAHLELGQDPERIEVRVGRRHVFRVGPKRERSREKGGATVDRDIVYGFAVELRGLEAAASLAVQVTGIGGRRHMGAGIFVPFGKERG